MIEVKDIVKSFEGNVVLNHVSTTLKDGEVNMIIGQILYIVCLHVLLNWR